jgi:hypothetical protein
MGSVDFRFAENFFLRDARWTQACRVLAYENRFTSGAGDIYKSMADGTNNVARLIKLRFQ